MAKSNQKTPVVFRLGIILLCCMLFTTYLMGNLYARYTTTASGSDSARVAKFDVTNSITQSVDLELDFFDAKKLSTSLSVAVASGSEVAVTYDVVVTLPTGIDLSWLEIKLGEKSPTVSGNTYTFSEVGKFAPNSNVTHTHTLTFSIKTESQGNPPDSLKSMETCGVQITVHSEQID